MAPCARTGGRHPETTPRIATELLCRLETPPRSRGGISATVSVLIDRNLKHLVRNRCSPNTEK
jgi:hypothetical protein